MTRMMTAGAIALTLTGLAASAALRAGQQPARPAPQTRGPITPHAYPLDDDHFVRWPLSSVEQAYARIEGTKLKQDVEAITAIARKSRDDGNQYWGRIAGTKYDDMVEALVENRFKTIGLQNVRRQYFDLPPQWFPISWDVSVISGGKTIQLKTAHPGQHSAATAAGGSTLDAAWVGLGTEADFAGRDVKGKAVFIYSVPAPSVINHSAAYLGALKRAEDHGASAAFVILGIPGNLESQLNTGADKIPSLSIGFEDGEAVRGMIERGATSVRLTLTTETKSGLRDASVWGELPGTTDEDIIVMAHHDSYFEGALDNASGMATMIGLADYFAKVPRASRRRTIKFVTTSGHHAGSFGVKWMHDNRSTFLARTALLLNCEHVSVAQTYYWGPRLRLSDTMDARRWWVYGSDRLANLALDAYRTFGVAVYHDMEPNASGDMGQASLDAPSVQMIESPAFYHTDHDTPAVVPAAGLESVARAYAKLIDSVNQLDRRDLMPKAAATSSTPAERGITR